MLLPLISLALFSKPQDPAGVVAGLQAFSRSLLGALPVRDGKNLVVSPFSVSECLALLIPGTGTADASMVAKSLHLPENPGDAGVGIQELNALLSGTPRGEVIVANSLWTGPGYNLTAAYRQTAGAQFNAQASVLPDTGAAGVKAVNDWIDAKTKGRILNLLHQLDPATSVVLVNAVSFDGEWQTKFKLGLTSAEAFNLLSPATKVDVPTMSLKSRLPYAKATNYQIVQLPYLSGEYSMLVVLPDSGTDPLTVLRSLDLANMPGMTSKFLDLKLPKFKFSSTFDLMHSLDALGLGSLAKGFDATPMLGTTRTMALSQLLHGAEIEVDENGTRAAAATIGGVVGTAIIRQPEPIPFHVDHPFAFAVIHTETHAPIFEGVVYDPVK